MIMEIYDRTHQSGQLLKFLDVFEDICYEIASWELQVWILRGKNMFVTHGYYSALLFHSKWEHLYVNSGIFLRQY